MAGALANVRAVAMSIAAPLAGAFALKGAIGSAANFEDAMTKSLSIAGDVTEAQTARMEQAAMNVSKTTTFSATAAAEAYYFLASAGLSAEQQISAMPAVAKFAQAGNFNLALATDLLTDAQSALGLSSKDAGQNLTNMTRVSDVLARASQGANATIQQFSESLTNRLGGALRSNNKSVEEGTAVLMAMADQGVKGARAGNELTVVMRDLKTAAQKNGDIFKKYGVKVFDENTGAMRNMGDIIADLEGGLGNLSDSEKTAAFTAMGLTATSQGIARIMIVTGKL